MGREGQGEEEGDKSKRKITERDREAQREGKDETESRDRTWSTDRQKDTGRDTNRKDKKLGMMAHTCTPVTQETEARESKVLAQLGNSA